MGSRSPTGRGTFEGTFWGDTCLPTERSHSWTQRIAHCSPAAAGECACPAQAANECRSPPRGVTRRRWGLLTNYFGHLLLHLLYTCYIINTNVRPNIGLCNFQGRLKNWGIRYEGPRLLGSKMWDWNTRKHYVFALHRKLLDYLKPDCLRKANESRIENYSFCRLSYEKLMPPTCWTCRDDACFQLQLLLTEQWCLHSAFSINSLLVQVQCSNIRTAPAARTAVQLRGNAITAISFHSHQVNTIRIPNPAYFQVYIPFPYQSETRCSQ